MLNRGETLKLRDLNAAFTEPARRSRSPTSRRRCSSSTSSPAFGDAGLHKLLRAYGAGPRHRRRAEVGAQHRFRRAAGRLRPERRAACSAACAGAQGARRRRAICSKMPLDALRPLAAQNPRQLSGADGARRGAARRRASSTRRCRRSSGPRRSCRSRPATTARTRRSPRSRSRRRTRRARSPRCRRSSRPTSTTSRRRGSSRRCCARATSPTRRRCGRSTQRIVADRSVRRRRARACSAASRCSATTPRPPIREFRTVLALGPVDRAAAHTDLAESYFKGGKRAEARKQTLAALEIAPSYERAQDLLLEAGGGQTVTRGAWRPAVLVAALLLTLVPVPPPRRRAAAGRARRSLRRPAVALRPHQVSLHDRRDVRPAGLLRRAVVHRRAGGRAEPVAPPQDRDLDPGRRSDRARRSTIRGSSAIRGSTSSSPAT